MGGAHSGHGQEQSEEGTPVVVRVKHDFEARDSEEMSVKKGSQLEVLAKTDVTWWRCRRMDASQSGLVPASYVEIEERRSVDNQHLKPPKHSAALILSPWYHGTISKGAANSIMKFAEKGSFLVRDSLTAPDQFVLVAKTMDINAPVCNYKIKRNAYGRFYIIEQNKFKNLDELLEFYRLNDGLRTRLLHPLPRSISVDREQNVWEINNTAVVKMKKLGEGNFGDVWKGMWSLPSGAQRTVAIKTLKTDAMSAEKFMAEAEVMKTLRHPNIVMLLAICNDADGMFILTEFMDKGDLLSVLRSSEGQKLDVHDFLAISHQIACGMKYLESKDFVHRDLAARNILISSENVVKIADFGLAKILNNEEDYYTGNEETCFPVKWTAPEAMDCLKFSVKSDIWSFGVTIHEIYTRGQTPYSGQRNGQLSDLLKSGFRLPRPREMQPDVYGIVRQCWEYEANKRPSFALIESELAKLDAGR